MPEEGDYAVDELDEAHDNPESFARRAANRRMSEYAAGAYRAQVSLERGKTDSANLKKALWSSSLGFPAMDSQSRRHSFANMPTRQGSISSLADSGAVAAALEASNAEMQASQEYVSSIPEDSSYSGGPSNSEHLCPLPSTIRKDFMLMLYQLTSPAAHR